MGIPEIVTTKVVVLGSAVVLAGSALVATVGSVNDYIEISGVAILGVVGLGWSIYAAGRDRRVRTYEEQEQLHRTLLHQTEDDLEECRKCRKRLIEENERLLVKIAHLDEEIKFNTRLHQD